MKTSKGYSGRIYRFFKGFPPWACFRMITSGSFAKLSPINYVILTQSYANAKIFDNKS
jgi:hypothetical protein